jgi:glucose-6-phosphate isomerase
MIAQAHAMAVGRDESHTRQEMQSQGLNTEKIDELAPHRSFKGNTPSSSIWLEELDAFSLGMLMALYEHKTFVQATIWGINPFDQWGVELGKTMAQQLSMSPQK